MVHLRPENSYIVTGFAIHSFIYLLLRPGLIVTSASFKFVM